MGKNARFSVFFIKSSLFFFYGFFFKTGAKNPIYGKKCPVAESLGILKVKYKKVQNGLKRISLIVI